MTDLLLGHSYFLRFDPKLWSAMQPFPPLGTLYAAGYLRERGYQVAVFDAMMAESESDWERALDRERPRFAILFEDNFNYLSKMCLLRMREAALTMIRSARQAGCTVLVAGADVTDNPEEYLSAGAGYAILGEGEITLGEIVDRLMGRTGVPFESIPGLAFRDPSGSGEVVRTARRQYIRDLDSLFFPAWDLVDMDRYRETWYRHHGFFSMNVVSSRGCPYHCSWCAKPIWGQRYNTRSPESVVAEMKLLRQTYQPDHIWFVDDIFGLKPGWTQRFADLVEQERVRIPFKSLQRVDLLLMGDTVPALARAGARTVWIGAESGSQKVLDAMDKGVRVEQIYEATRRLHAAGIEVAFFLQFGYPGETLEDIEKTLQMVRDCRPDDIGIAVSYPLPGTRFYEAIKSELGTKRNWVDSSDLAMMYRGPFSTDFYRQLHTVVHKEFRARRAWRSLLGVAREPGSAGRRHIRQAAALAHQILTLPLARARLDRLARLPHEGLGPLPRSMTPEAAALPTGQAGEE
jgi:anaerobic magnesium-protoporphyrin IX monomethyl ester cyclase